MTDRHLPTNRKLHKAFPLGYLYLTLTHSKSQGQGHANFDRSNVAISNKYIVDIDLLFEGHSF